MRVVHADVERTFALVDVVPPVRFAVRYQRGCGFEVVRRQQVNLIRSVIATGDEREGP